MNGAPLDVSELDYTDISMSADGGANWAPPIQVPADAVQTFVVDDLTPGSYLFRATVQDKAGRRSADADVAGEVLAEPSAIADLSVTIE